ncbi:hypothetical protein ACTFIZ_006397 [Dictyostelium cf. discoideum]
MGNNKYCIICHQENKGNLINRVCKKKCSPCIGLQSCPNPQNRKFHNESRTSKQDDIQKKIDLNTLSMELLKTKKELREHREEEKEIKKKQNLEKENNNNKRIADIMNAGKNDISKENDPQEKKRKKEDPKYVNNFSREVSSTLGIIGIKGENKNSYHFNDTKTNEDIKDEIELKEGQESNIQCPTCKSICTKCDIEKVRSVEDLLEYLENRKTQLNKEIKSTDDSIVYFKKIQNLDESKPDINFTIIP